MIIGFHRSFGKQFKQLSASQQEKVKKALIHFQQDPHRPLLRNHPLKGEWARYRSISAGGDLRIHYRILKEDKALCVAVGTHNQLYK